MSGLTATSSLRLRRVNDSADIAMAQAIAIYLDSIKASERKPSQWLAAAAARADFVLLIATTAADDVIGFSLTYAPAGEDFALLEYLAVAADHRGKGTGSFLFDRTAKQLPGRAMLVEVDEETVDCDAARRIGFYRRLGCNRVVGLRYQLPLPDDPPPMALLVTHPTSPLPRLDLARWLRCIYTQVYEQPADDPRLRRMTDSLPEWISLQ